MNHKEKWSEECFIKDVIPGTSSFSEETEHEASLHIQQLSLSKPFGLALNCSVPILYNFQPSVLDWND